MRRARTSRDAHDEFGVGKHANNVREVIYAFLRVHNRTDGWTRKEIAKELQYNVNTVNARATELVDGGAFQESEHVARDGEKILFHAGPYKFVIKERSKERELYNFVRALFWPTNDKDRLSRLLDRQGLSALLKELKRMTKEP